MIIIDDKDIRRFERDLKKFAKDAFPFATKSAMNGSAFFAQKLAKANVRSQMINRNKFSEQSIQVDQTKTLNVNNQEAVVGSIADYMETQEFGGTKTNPTIATSYSAGQGMNTKPRTRLPRKANKMANIRLSKRRKKGLTRKQRIFNTIRQAAADGRKYIFLDLGKREGIFKVIGGKRRPKIKMVHNTGIRSVNIPRNQWLEPAVDATPVADLYKKALRFQLKRRGLFHD